MRLTRVTLGTYVLHYRYYMFPVRSVLLQVTSDPRHRCESASAMRPPTEWNVKVSYRGDAVGSPLVLWKLCS